MQKMFFGPKAYAILRAGEKHLEKKNKRFNTIKKAIP